MLKSIVSLAIIGTLFIGCSWFGDGMKIKDPQKKDEKSEFSIKWKSSGKQQRGKMLDVDKLYGWLKGKDKNEVERFLGKPDQVNEFGEFVYLIGLNEAKGHVYERQCRVCFDGGSSVVRIESDMPE